MMLMMKNRVGDAGVEVDGGAGDDGAVDDDVDDDVVADDVDDDVAHDFCNDMSLVMMVMMW